MILLTLIFLSEFYKGIHHMTPVSYVTLHTFYQILFNIFLLLDKITPEPEEPALQHWNKPI